jgi:hypothetical protein
MRRSLLPALALLVSLGACTQPSSTTAAPPASASGAPVASQVKPAEPFAELDRATFNRMAVRLNLPIYWRADLDKDGAVDPLEIATLLFYPSTPVWLESGAFSKAFEDAYKRMVRASKMTAGVVTPETERQRLVVEELDGAAPTLVYSDLRALSPADHALLDHLLGAARAMDALYARQNGSSKLAAKVPDDDAASRSLFRRNWGPRCLTPQLEKNAACTAIADAPKMLVSVYPDALQADVSFCDKLEKLPDAKKLLDPFVAVTGDSGKLVATPFSQAYAAETGDVAKELSAAADAVTDPSEAPLKAYLAAAAKSFTTNDWRPADEAWSKMSATNSKWYVRAAPDETYWEPCSHKAGFHLDVARINRASLAWQEKLTPVQQDMEDAFAKVAGAPYKSRKVSFHLPDFIDVVLNAGESRDPIGATIGQSLPNWGPVAAEGRGRTVAMSNLYTDPDSLEMRRTRSESLLTKDALAFYVDDAEPGLLSTILHEATHNLGPAHEYKAAGKTDDQSFGGDLASMMEELKAQSGALYFVEFLRARGLLTDLQAKRTYADAIVWALHHIARGMTTEDGHRKPYSQLAAVQIGFLLDEGALTWDDAAAAANGRDRGALGIAYEKMPQAIDKLMKVVAELKAKGDRPGAEALAKKYVEGPRVPQKAIVDRILRFPQPSFVFAVDR